MAIPRTYIGANTTTTTSSGSGMPSDEEKRRLYDKDFDNDNDDFEQREATAANTSIGSIHSSTSMSSQSQEASKQGQSSGDETPPSRAMVIFSVLFYLVAALVMVIVNKWVLNSVSVPLFFLFVQLAIAVVLLHVSQMLGYFTIPHIHLSTCRGLLPLVSINVTGLIFNTYCLQYVDASFYQVARGLVLPFTVFFSYLLLSSRSSTLSLAAVGVVCVGFFLGVSGESLHASTTGTMLGVFSSLTTSVHAIVVKKSLNVVQGSTMDLVYYNNLLSAILLSPLVILSGESSLVTDMFVEGGKPLNTFLGGAAITGVFGFLICIAGFLSIKVTSPVTHMISSAVRGVIQTFLGMWCFGDIITAGRGSGILFILLGSTLYTYAKEQEQRAREAIASYGRLPSSSSSNSIHSNAPINPVNAKRSPNLKKLAINTSSPSSSPSTFAHGAVNGEPEEGPRTPRSIVNPNERLPGSGGASSRTHTTINLSTPKGLSPQSSAIGTQAGIINNARRLSFNGSPEVQKNINGHAKNVSASELRDILVSSHGRDRFKDEKVY